MPKVSKINSKPKRTAMPKDMRDGGYYCTRCDRSPSKTPRGVYLVSQSQLYKNNARCLPICKDCINDLFIQYADALDSEELAVKRLCMKLDIYWAKSLYYSRSYKMAAGDSPATAYIKTVNMRFAGKTYDDTLDEEYNAEVERILQEEKEKELLTLEEEAQEDEPEVEEVVEEKPITEITDDPEVEAGVIHTWGIGYLPSQYYEFERQYRKWALEYEDPDNLPPSEKGLLRQIVLLEWRINVEQQKGGDVSSLVGKLTSILRDLKLTPKEKDNAKKNEEVLAAQQLAEAAEEEEKEKEDLLTPLGVAIKLTEDDRPIIDADPDFQDVDGIGRYISIWFFGHLSKMFNIKNKYSKMYEEELDKYRVTLKTDGDDSSVEEDIFSKIFGSKNDKDGRE